jgi:hypothetical protein
MEVKVYTQKKNVLVLDLKRPAACHRLGMGERSKSFVVADVNHLEIGKACIICAADERIGKHMGQNWKQVKLRI